MAPLKIAIIDDEAKITGLLVKRLTNEGFDTRGFTDPLEFLKENNSSRYDIVFSDIKMPGADGVQVLSEIKEAHPDTEVVLFTAFADSETAAEVLDKGAYDYIIKPFPTHKILNIIANLREKIGLKKENQNLRTGRQALSYRENGSFAAVVSKLKKAARTDSTILITGESGTGKTLMASVIHENSARKDGKFIPVNCSLLPEGLIESELFGHEKGAFTGALKKKEGWIEKANGGTVFFDEIGDISATVQLKLLRLVQDRVIERVGGRESIPLDIRIIFATNRDLEALVKEGKFREDLYHRINVLRFHSPALRERPEDLPLLIESITAAKAAELQMPGEVSFSNSVMKIFGDYEWPGNIRELENTIESCLVMREKEEVDTNDLPAGLKPGKTTGSSDSELIDEICQYIIDNRITIDNLERDILKQVLKRTDNNHTKAAALTGLSRRSFSYRIKG